jgi:hypothetical protein
MKKETKVRSIKRMIKADYENAVLAYIKEFEAISEIEFEGWTGNFGTIANFADYFIDFNDLRYVIDNDVDFADFSTWHWYCVENNDMYYNIDSYVRLLRDAKYKAGFNFSQKEFETYLVELRKNSDNG